MDNDRTVHGFTPDHAAIARYERGGHWYLEPKTGPRRKVSLAVAVREAVAGRARLGLPGGTQFDARVRRAQSEKLTPANEPSAPPAPASTVTGEQSGDHT